MKSDVKRQDQIEGKLKSRISSLAILSREKQQPRSFRKLSNTTFKSFFFRCTVVSYLRSLWHRRIDLIVFANCAARLMKGVCNWQAPPSTTTQRCWLVVKLRSLLEGAKKIKLFENIHACLRRRRQVCLMEGN